MRGSGRQGWKGATASEAHVLERVICVMGNALSRVSCHSRRKCQGVLAGPGESNPGKPPSGVQRWSVTHCFIYSINIDSIKYLLGIYSAPGAFLEIRQKQ